MELLKSMASTDLLPVPCKRGGAAFGDPLAGNVQAMFVSYAADGVKAIGAAPEFLTRYIQTERIKWAEVVKR